MWSCHYTVLASKTPRHQPNGKSCFAILSLYLEKIIYLSVGCELECHSLLSPAFSVRQLGKLHLRQSFPLHGSQLHHSLAEGWLWLCRQHHLKSKRGQRSLITHFLFGSWEERVKNLFSKQSGYRWNYEDFYLGSGQALCKAL